MDHLCFLSRIANTKEIRFITSWLELDEIDNEKLAIYKTIFKADRVR